MPEDPTPESRRVASEEPEWRPPRLEKGPAFARGERRTFRFNGRAIHAYEGETVGAALHAHGERVLMRSIKYHRPRGLFCMTGKCANCLMRIDGAPNVRACVTPVAEGMKVETQNAFPNARRDFFSLVDKVYRRNFDYHERFIRPRVLTPVYHAVIRRMAGFGKIPDLRPVAPRRPPVVRREVDVLVVGAGPAGLSAAASAAEGAADVLVVEETSRAGGSLLLEREGVRAAEELVQRVEEAGGEVRSEAVAFGVYRTDGQGSELAPPGHVAVLTPKAMLHVVPHAVVVATGYHETPPAFAGNDLPGVMGSRAALILLHRQRILPGRRFAVAQDTPLSRQAAADLEAAGAECVGIVGEGAWKGARIVEAHGGTSVERVSLLREGERWSEEVDLVLSAGDETPRIELLQQAGVPLVPQGFAMGVEAQDGATAIAGVFAAGSVRGMKPLDERLRDGVRAGEAAARRVRS